MKKFINLASLFIVIENKTIGNVIIDVDFALLLSNGDRLQYGSLDSDNMATSIKSESWFEDFGSRSESEISILSDEWSGEIESKIFSGGNLYLTLNLSK